MSTWSVLLHSKDDILENTKTSVLNFGIHGLFFFFWLSSIKLIKQICEVKTVLYAWLATGNCSYSEVSESPPPACLLTVYPTPLIQYSNAKIVCKTPHGWHRKDQADANANAGRLRDLIHSPSRWVFHTFHPLFKSHKLQSPPWFTPGCINYLL